MRFTLLIALAVVLLAATAFTYKHQNAKINTEASNVEWTGKKVTGEHTGTIKIKSGTLTVHGEKVVSGNVIMDMTSITNTDLEDAKSKANLEGHLKSEDFFGVEKHPTSTFKITAVKDIKETDKGYNVNVSGPLTIKGISHEISFPARIEVDGKSVIAYSTLEIDRSKWNVRYGSGSFFDNLGDKVIEDMITITFRIAAEG